MSGLRNVPDWSAHDVEFFLLSLMHVRRCTFVVGTAVVEGDSFAMRRNERKVLEARMPLIVKTMDFNR